MAGNLTLDQLKKAVTAGEIDTVLVCLADMQGRLIGKRFQAEYFLEIRPRGDAWLRLPPRQRHRHGAGARLRRRELGERLRRLHHEAGPGDADAACRGWRRRRWCCATCSTTTIRAIAAQPARHPEEAARAAGGAQDARLFRLGAGILPVRRDLRDRAGKRYARPCHRRPLHRGLSHPADHQGGGRHARRPQGPARRRHPGRELQGRMGPGPGGDQRPLRRCADHGGQPRHPEERRQGDRPRARQGRDLHGQMGLLARRLVEPHPCLAVGRARHARRSSTTPRPSTA